MTKHFSIIMQPQATSMLRSVLLSILLLLALAQAAEAAITVSGTAYQNDEATDVGDGEGFLRCGEHCVC